MAKDAYWFRHDANARNDIKVIELRSLHGYEGYGIYFAILEVMREQAHYAIPENKIGMVGVALGEPPQKVAGIIEDCIEAGLFVREDGLIYSPSFINRLSKWEDVKNRNETNGAKGGRPKANPSNNPKHNPNNNPNETQNKPRREEKRIEEEKREENTKTACEFPTLEDCKQASQMDGFTEKQGEAYYHLRNSTDWLIPRGKSGNLYPVANWRSDMHNVISQGWLDKKPDTGKPDASETYKNWKPL